MWYQTIAITSLVIICNGQHDASKNNNSDVIVTYEGHAEAIAPKYQKPIAETTTTEPRIKILIPESYATETTMFYEDDTEGVVFVPNEKPVFRNDYHDDRVSIVDVLGNNVVNVDKKIQAATEQPNEDILFISGKNRDQADKLEKKKEKEYLPGPSMKEKKKDTLNCRHLDCNNTMEEVCGGKLEHKTWKYRLFLNECYFRKVNCGFKYDMNRYREMPLELCKPVASHYSERPFVYNHHPLPTQPQETPAPFLNSRRNWSSRRSLNLELDGRFCSHACPHTCPEEYVPECAVTTKGRRKVFVNHCRLDYDSCSYGTVWHRRPLSECVGSKKADLRNNRAFIGWMQQIGIVDDKGRLVQA